MSCSAQLDVACLVRWYSAGSEMNKHVLWPGTGVDITLVSTDVEGSTELWEWVSASSMRHAVVAVCIPLFFILIL